MITVKNNNLLYSLQIHSLDIAKYKDPDTGEIKITHINMEMSHLAFNGRRMTISLGGNDLDILIDRINTALHGTDVLRRDK